MGKRHQLAIAVLSVVLFLVGTAPLEVQRRIINSATEGASYSSILSLVLLYVALVLSEGLIKLVLNVYRSWIGEAAIRWLRMFVLSVSDQSKTPPQGGMIEGVQLSIVLAEADPVGGFVGTGISEPLLQAGILFAVGGYLIFLQPSMTLVVALVFVPQLGFVPWMQNAINRRVESKIGTFREVSRAMIEALVTDDERLAQSNRVQRLFSTNMIIYKLKFAMNFLMNFMTQIGYVGIFTLGGYYVITGKTEIGTVVAFLSGVAKITDPWGALVDWYRDLKTNQVKYAMIRDAANAAAEADDHPPFEIEQTAAH